MVLVVGTNLSWLLMKVLTSLCGLGVGRSLPGSSSPFSRACANSDASVGEVIIVVNRRVKL